MTPEAKEKAWAKRLLDNYKLTPAMYYAILNFQAGVCYLCGQTERVPGRRLAVDHDHDTGVIRGLLCSRCNPIIGKLERVFKRFGLFKEGKVTLTEWVHNFGIYLGIRRGDAGWLVEKALGHRHYGYVGQVGTKAHRARIKRDKRQVTPSVPTLTEEKNGRTKR